MRAASRPKRIENRLAFAEEFRQKVMAAIEEGRDGVEMVVPTARARQIGIALVAAGYGNRSLAADGDQTVLYITW